MIETKASKKVLYSKFKGIKIVTVLILIPIMVLISVLGADLTIYYVKDYSRYSFKHLIQGEKCLKKGETGNIATPNCCPEFVRHSCSIDRGPGQRTMTGCFVCE